MIKKGFIFLLALALMAAFNMGLMDRKIKMSFIKTPVAMMMMGNQHENQLVQLSEKLQVLQETNGSQADQTAISTELQQISQADAVNTEDQKFMTTLINDIKNSQGTINQRKIVRPENQRIYVIQFGFNNLTQDTEEEYFKNVTNGYFPSIYLFPNNLALMPTVSPTDKTKIATIEVRLSDATVKYIVDYYNKNVKKL
jgi:hypothetical protein